MPTIPINDQFGLDVDATPAPTSALLKYFKQLPTLRFDSLDLSKVGGLTLDQPALDALSTGVSFQDPISLGDGAPSLSVGAGAHASIELITDADDLPGHGDEVELNDACYLRFAMEATASAGVSQTQGSLQFGASPSAKLEIASCSRFPLKGGVTLLQALQKTVGDFAICAKTGDLADLPAGQITQVALSGKLTLSGSADLLATTNPLASAALPAPLPGVSVSAGGSVTVGVSCEIETEYEVVARKLDTGAVRLGWYHKTGTEVSVSVSASEGLSAELGSTDLFSKVVGAISASPKADLDAMAKAGVPDSQAAAIQDAVKAATNRKLEIAVGAEISAGESQDAVFLFEIDSTQLTAESRQAVDQALRGDLTALHAPAVAGVTCVRSIWDNVRKHRVELDVNLLGILNFRSVASLTLAGKVMFEPATGALVISDTATAARIQSTQLNFGADSQKLRHVLAESFLITAAYHGARQTGGSAALRCSHNFFELQNSTGAGDIARKLRTGVALGLLASEDATPPAEVPDFGRTLFTAATDYDDALAERMFLDANEGALPRDAYENAGRNAIQFLVKKGDVDEVRLRPATDDALWKQMKSLGQPGIPGLFPNVAAPLVGAITADYTAIQWWAAAMSGTAAPLAAVRLWLARNPNGSIDDPAFQKLRQDLAARLAAVAANTHDHFGQPWGLIAMSLLVNRNSGARFLLTGPRLVLEKRRDLAAGTGR